VLVDTEPVATRVLMAMLAEVGIAMSEPECLRTFVGRSAAGAIAIIEERLGSPVSRRAAATSACASPLGASGLLPRFAGRIFSATEVARGKPFPHVFLHAAGALAAAPARTAVVEDSAAGVTAGIAAGMAVFAYTGGDHSDPAELTAGAVPFARMPELPSLLAAAPSPRV